MADKLFCEICGTQMVLSEYVQKDGHARDNNGNLIAVSRRFFYCPKCKTIASLSFRKDGQMGDLAGLIRMQKDGILPKRTSLHAFEEER